MIDVSKIPAADVRVLSSTVLEAVKRFYDDPINQRRFEEWQKEREKKNDGGIRNA